MLKIATIGIGNAGNQIAELAAKTQGIPGIAINSSNSDLVGVGSIPTLTLGDSKGAGKNRDEAKKFIRSQIGAILKEATLCELIESNDYIFMISSIGGGTGSGMTPVMTDILSKRYPSKKFVIIGVYPPISESIAAQQNAIDFLKEVNSGMPDVTYMSYDNQKYADLPVSECLQSVNRDIVSDLVVLRGDYRYTTVYNSIDDKDLHNIIATPGRLACYSAKNIKEKDVDNKTLDDIMIDVIKNKSSQVELDRDKIVKRLGLITSLTPNLNAVLKSDIRDIKSLIGEPVEGFEHIHVSEDSKIQSSMHIIISGLSVPNDRIIKISERISEGVEALKRSAASSVLADIDTSDIKNLRTSTPTTANGQTEFDLDELMSKY